MPHGDNVEILRIASERLNAGDLDDFLGLCAVDIEAHDRPSAPDFEVHRGHDGVRAWWLKLTDGLTNLSLAVDMLPEAGDSVVLEAHALGRRRESVGGDDLVFFIAATLREKAIATIVAAGDRITALDAAGVPEGAAAQAKIDLAKSMYAAFSKLAEGGDIPAYVDAHFHPECECQPLGANVIRGHEELIHWHQRRIEAWEELRPRYTRLSKTARRSSSRLRSADAA